MTQGTRASHGIDALEAAEWCRINIWRQKEELPLNIKNPLADELARRLSRKTGHSITDVVIDALREQLRREEGRIAAPALAIIGEVARVPALARELAASVASD